MTHRQENTESENEFEEVERYEFRESKPYTFQADRREFVQSVGAGVIVAVAARRATAQGRTARRDEQLSERFHFGEDGFITVLTSKVEVGQGSRTQIAQAAAEEFRVPVERIRLIMADTEQCPDDGGTAGSRTTPSTVPRVRNAAAAARNIFMQLAANQLGVAVSQLRLSDGVFATDTGERLAMSDLLQARGVAAALQVAPPADGITVTPVSEWKVLGTDALKANGRAVVTGTHQYPSDVIRPGMLYGKVLRPTTLGASLKSIELEPAKAMEGVTVVRDGEFVGCVATTSWQAQQACDALAATANWQASQEQQTSSDELFAHLKNTARESSGSSGDGKTWDATRKALPESAKAISSKYTVAYIQHAPMEPRAAVAEWTEGKLTVWTGTQQPSRVHSQLCETFRLPSERVRVIVPDTGGGFGGKHTGEAAIEAARLAKSAGKPVHLRWTREEEFTWAYFRPAGLIEVSAAIDDAGKLLAWDFANYNSGGSAIESPYTVPNGRSRFINTDFPLRQGSYRALASTANVFARESAMDELAILADVDPLNFRLQNLEPGRLRDVLIAAAEKFDWHGRRATLKPNRGIGLACGTEKGSYTAACTEIEIIDNEVRVIHACQAFECGAIHNPANLRRQVEGCLVMGIGGALYEEIKFANGKLKNPQFSDYRVPRVSDLPELDIVLLNRLDLPSVGGSETPIIAIAPAIANAVFNSCGQRSRSLPIRLV